MGRGECPSQVYNRVALLLTRNNERGPGPTHGLRLFESKVFSAYDPGATIKRTNGPLFNGLLRRSHPAVLPRNGSPTPVIHKLLLPEGTPRLITDVFYARFMGPRKQGIGTNPTMYFFFQDRLWMILSSLTSDTEAWFTLGITSVLLET